jgi:hypothetical protein
MLSHNRSKMIVFLAVVGADLDEEDLGVGIGKRP